MKKFFKYLFFPNRDKQKILSGPSKGMYVKYDVNHRSQHLLGLYEREIYPWLKKGIKRSEVLIDIGANDGYYVMGFLKTGKTVIACEPGPIVDELIYNANLNGYDESGRFIIERKLIGSGPSSDFVPVEGLVKNFHGSLFFLVDIDGGEFELLGSCGENFNHGSATWLIETHTRELENNCIDFLSKKKYKVTIIKNGWWRKIIPEQRPLAHNRWLFAEPM